MDDNFRKRKMVRTLLRGVRLVTVFRLSSWNSYKPIYFFGVFAIICSTDCNIITLNIMTKVDQSHLEDYL